MYNDGLIYDVGAHLGEDTDFYLKKGFDVVAVEANPQLVQQLKARFAAELQSERLRIANVAIVERGGGEVDFFVDKAKSIWGTVDQKWAEKNKSRGGGDVIRISVPAKSLTDLMKEYGVPRYCKIDIEGNDLIAMKSLKELSQRPKFVSMETEKISWRALVAEMDALRELGYSRFNIVDQNIVNRQVCPNPPLERNYLEHKFPKGSSGLFGEELPGKWVDYFEAMQVFKLIFIGYALNGDSGVFRRRIAVLNLLRNVDRLVNFARGWGELNDPRHALPDMGWHDIHATS